MGLPMYALNSTLRLQSNSTRFSIQLRPSLSSIACRSPPAEPIWHYRHSQYNLQPETNTQQLNGKKVKFGQ